MGESGRGIGRLQSGGWAGVVDGREWYMTVSGRWQIVVDENERYGREMEGIT